MRNLLITLLLILAYSNSFSQRIFITNDKSIASYKVFITKSKPDLNVYITKYLKESRVFSSSDNNGIWMFVKTKEEADLIIFITKNIKEADYTIRYVEFKSMAGWTEK